MRIHPLLLALCLPALVLAAGTAKAGKRASGPVTSSKEAKAIAEQETGGKAVSARRTALNGASGGWEVEVRMPRETKGWLCLIDADTHLVHSKTRIPQPGGKAKPEPAPRVVKGTR